MQTLHQFQNAFEQYLQENRFEWHPKELYEPANYILSIGGKRLRPVVLLVAHYLFDDDFKRSLPAAAAVEVFHNFTLVHDDIMDAAPLRRGLPTVHHKYGLNAGILSGDVMLVLAYDQLLKTQSPLNGEILSAFTRMAIEVCEGQQMDMNFEQQSDVKIEEYLEMITLKTAVLVATALKMGALIGGASAEDAAHLYEFGKNLGIAFQLQDDILDAFGDPKKVGKKAGGDIAQNKKTFLYLKALEKAPTELADNLKRFFAGTTQIDEETKITEVLSIFRVLGVEEWANDLKEQYWKLSLNSLGKVKTRPGRGQILEKFAEALMNRDF
ncbi:MAG: polyprenyl synthetase family protein [Saprospiraceae bacterium]|nr:polyprenyl synthetase family protein [Saprospiraceae bacterium]